MDREDEAPAYRVVTNDRGEFSIWHCVGEVPAGWIATGTEGSKDECLAHIERTWQPDYLSVGGQPPRDR